jgi:chemotaxis protein CheX
MPPGRQLPNSGDWVNLIHKAAAEVFAMMVGIQLEAIEQPAGKQQCGITAMVGLAGIPTGIFSVSCSIATATAIAGSMLGAAGLPSQDQLCDALGEICNMVTGSIRQVLRDQGVACLMSVPTVVHGSDYVVQSKTTPFEISTAMRCGDRPILFSLQLRPENSEPSNGIKFL